MLVRAGRLALCLIVVSVCACSAAAVTSTRLAASATPSTPLESSAPSLEPATSPAPPEPPTPTLTPTPAPTLAPTPVPTPPTVPAVRLQRVMSGLAFNQMTGAFQAPDGRWYVLEQVGRIRTFREGDATGTVFLDIRDHVVSGGELGLLGFAMAPDFAQTGVFFVDYTRGNPLRTEIASFTSNGSVADKASEVVLLEIAQPYENHNGGQLAFGPDGFLYIGMGDGGSGGDPQRNGQNRNALLGKVLRIDVSDRTRYRVPVDNPFASGGGRGEIWALGLRNPWRFSFDTETGALWLADVGQDAYEEIDLVTRGGNYGWNVMEGMHCYNASSCATAGLALPLVEYPHTLGCSVTGGFVNRGATELRGVYLYADFCSGRIWGLRYQGGRVVAQAQVGSAGFSVGSFAQDRAGEVYLLQYSGAGGIYKVTR